MKTLRYKPEYLARAAELLETAENAVDLPSYIFFDIARLFEDRADNDKLEKLSKKFSRAYTMLAVDGDKVVGMASMDKEGNVGIFVVKDGETYSKSCRLLFNALYRRAEQKELPYLFVLPRDGAKVRFEKYGYLPFENGEVGEGNTDSAVLAKKVEGQKKLDIAPESVKRYILDDKKKITVEGKFSIFPAVFFGTACFFAALLTVISITTYEPERAPVFLFFDVLVGIFFAVALTILIWYCVRGRRLKKEVLSMRVTNGVITSLDEIVVRDTDSGSDSYNTVKNTHVYIAYAFFDDDMQKRTVEFSHKYNGSAPYFYNGQELVVAYSESNSYILSKYTVLDETRVVSAPEENADTADGAVADTTKSLEESTIDIYVPIGAAKMYYAYAFGILAALMIVVVACVIFAAVAAYQTGSSFWKMLLNFVPFWGICFVILGVQFARCFVVPIRTKAQYNELLRRSGVRIANGKLMCSKATHKDSGKLWFYCEYTADGKKKQVKVPRIFASRLVKIGKTSVKVIFDSTTALVLVRRNRYPDVFAVRLRKGN